MLPGTRSLPYITPKSMGEQSNGRDILYACTTVNRTHARRRIQVHTVQQYKKRAAKMRKIEDSNFEYGAIQHPRPSDHHSSSSVITLS